MCRQPLIFFINSRTLQLFAVIFTFFHERAESFGFRHIFMNELSVFHNRKVYKRSDMIQQGRFSLTSLEFKAVSYLISKVNPNDQINKVYHFNCREFHDLMHWSPETNYRNTKGMLQRLADKGWWITLPNGQESYVHWIYLVHMNPGNGDISIKFHEDMAPYIMNLKKQHAESGVYITSWDLESIGPMCHEYSPKIYELLKSYANNKQWKFEFGTGTERDIRILLAKTEVDPKNSDKRKVYIPKNWEQYGQFNRDVLQPAKEEINKYTDLMIDYEGRRETFAGEKCRKTSVIVFTINIKNDREKQEAEMHVLESYEQDGIIDIPNIKPIPKDMEDKANATPYPMFYLKLCKEFTDDQIANIYSYCIRGLEPGKINRNFYDAWALDYVSHYYDWIKATPDDTKTTTYKRLLSSVANDYDGIRNIPSQWDK